MKRFLALLIFLICFITVAYADVKQMTGFETGDLSECSLAAGGAVISGSPARVGGSWALRSNVFAGAGNSATCQIIGLAADGTESVAFDLPTSYLRFYFIADTLPSAEEMFIKYLNMDFDDKASFRITPTGALKACNTGGTCSSASATTLSLHTWYRIEIKLSTGVGSTPYQVLVNGVSALSGSMDQTVQNMREIRLGKANDINGSAVDFSYDDVLLDDAAFPGAGQNSVIYPNADGTTQNCTAGTGASNYLEVDERPTDDDATRVEKSAGASQQCMFNLLSAVVGGVSGNINAVKGRIRAKESVSGTSAAAIKLLSAAASVTSATKNLGTTYSEQYIIARTDPNTSAAWTVSGINSLQCGMIDTSTLATVRLTTTDVYVDYDPGAPTPTPTPGPSTPTPTPTATPTVNPVTPHKQEWIDQWIEWSSRENDYMVSQDTWVSDKVFPTPASPGIVNTPAAGNQFNASYYDALKNELVMPQVIGTPAIALTRAPVMRRAYRETYIRPNNGNVPGFRIFTSGFRKDYELTGNVQSKEAINMQHLNGAFNSASTPLSQTADPNGETSDGGARENAYRIMAELDARAVGYTPRAVLDDWLDQALSHLDIWTVSQTSTYVRPFMVSLVTKALIQAYEEYPSYSNRNQIQPAILAAYEYIWVHNWVPYNPADPYSRSFKYTDRDVGNLDPPDLQGAPELNGLIAPTFAWLLKQTHDNKWAYRGDEVFYGIITTYDIYGFWVRGPFLGPKSTSSSGKKEFNQLYYWSDKYPQYREEAFGTATPTPGPSTPTPTPTNTPTNTPTPVPTATPTVTPTPTITPTPLPRGNAGLLLGDGMGAF